MLDKVAIETFWKFWPETETNITTLDWSKTIARRLDQIIWCFKRPAEDETFGEEDLQERSRSLGKLSGRKIFSVDILETFIVFAGAS